MSAPKALLEFFRTMERTSLVLNESKRPSTKGTSRIGGVPDLPEDFVWPRYSLPATEQDPALDNVPLTFVAQIDCSAVYAILGEESMLPPSGMIWFFYEMSSQRWGFEPADEGCARVYYADLPTEKLLPTPPPKDLEEEYRFQPYALTFEKARSLPDYEEAGEYSNYPTEVDDWDDYDEARAKYLNTDEDTDYSVLHRLFGYANLIQGEMLTECQLTASGVNTGHGYPDMTPEEKQDLKDKAPQWQLLLQIASSEKDDNRMFGDCGNLYFYIRKEDLAARRFDKIWLILQCG